MAEAAGRDVAQLPTARAQAGPITPLQLQPVTAGGGRRWLLWTALIGATLLLALLVARLARSGPAS